MDSILSYIHPPSPILPNTAAFFGAIFLGMGINALFRPAAGLEIFGFPRPTKAADAKLTDNLMRIYGIRDVYMGAAMLAPWWYGNRVLLGWTTGFTAMVSLVDGLVQVDQTGDRVMNHWGHGGMEAVVAVLLLMNP